MSTESNKSLKIYNPSQLSAAGIVGELFEGKYVQKIEKQREDKNGKPFMSKAHLFNLEDGSDALLNSSGLLDYLITKKNVQAGDSVKVFYFGKDKTDRHKFDIAVNGETKANIEVVGATKLSSPSKARK